MNEVSSAHLRQGATSPSIAQSFVTTCLAPLHDRSWSRGRDSLVMLPRPFQYFVLGNCTALFVGVAIAAKACIPAHAAVIAVLIALCYVIVPTEPDASGGVAVFHTPLYYGVALLFDPASVFIGISVGTLIGRSLVPPSFAPWHWRVVLRAATAGLHVASAATAVGALTARMQLPLAMLFGPTVAVGTGLTVNTILHVSYSSFRYGLPWWIELVAKLRDRYYDQAMELVWAVPVAIGAVFVPAVWWPAMVTITVGTSLLNWQFMTAEKRRSSDAMTRIVGHTLPTDDPAVRELAEELALGVMVVSPDGAVLSLTQPCLRVLKRAAIERNTQLGELCVAEDIPLLHQVINQACSAQRGANTTLRILDDDGDARAVRFGFVNRLHDPAVRGLVATVMTADNDAPSTKRIQSYVNQALAAEMLEAQEDERTRVAQELEDLRQIITFDAEITASVPIGPSALQRAIGSIQRTLRAPAIDHFGLEDAVREHCSSVPDTGGGTIVVESDLPHGQRFGRTVELTMYRVVQDAVAVFRRAALSRIKVTLSIYNGALQAVVEGAGPWPDVGLPPLGRRALMLLTARAQIVGGSIRTETREVSGCCIIIEVPVDYGRPA
jgi:hypothetical protein